MHEPDAPRIFTIPYRHYEFKSIKKRFSDVSKELRNISAMFQRLIDQVLLGLQGNKLFIILMILLYI